MKFLLTCHITVFMPWLDFPSPKNRDFSLTSKTLKSPFHKIPLVCLVEKFKSSTIIIAFVGVLTGMWKIQNTNLPQLSLKMIQRYALDHILKSSILVVLWFLLFAFSFVCFFFMFSLHIILFLRRLVSYQLRLTDFTNNHSEFA